MAKKPAAKPGTKTGSKSGGARSGSGKSRGIKSHSKTSPGTPAKGAAKHAAVARRGLMLVLSSPSGAGKTTLSRMLLEADSKVELSVSVTTRRKRPGEIDGRDYHFIDRPTFDTMVARNELLEWAEVFGNCYGTPRTPVEAALTRGRDVLFDIDWQGTQPLREKANRDLVSIFVLPPSIPDLEKRLRTRAQDSDEVIHGRMTKAADEMSHWPEYDYVVINTDIDRAFWEVRAILSAERLKRERQTGLTDFVRGLQAKL
jgi:guanylate kinase